jgi:alpha-tubulin suppressor-like RCC1 family protein
MSWKILYNGNCPAPPPEGLRFVKVASGYDVNMTIDNAGRLYAWGNAARSYQGQTPVAVPSTPNFTRHPATFRDSPEYYESMVYPYQIGVPKSDWVDCQTYEYVSMAMDSDGYIYAVGKDDGFGRCGWTNTGQYNDSSSTHVFSPGGDQAIVMTLVNDQQWAKFSLGAYHVLAQKADKSLWIWGTNTDDVTYGSVDYIEDYVSLTPILMDWLPGPVKLFDANYSVNVIVTEGNQIYGWGAWWMDTAYGPTPTLIPLTIPVGVTISDAKCCAAGIVVLLSNGDVYGIGYDIGFVNDQAMVFTKAPGDHHFVKLFTSIENGAAALDTSGVIWAWGNQSYLIVQGGTDDLASFEPMITGGSVSSSRRWIDFAPGSWSHLAIDNQGRLFSWGTPVFGLLGIGKFEDEADEQYAAIECGPFATLDNGTLAYEEGISGSAVALTQIRRPLPQLQAHNPCGHWHKGGGDTARKAESYAANCWEPTIATDGTKVLYVIAGRHRPNELYMLWYHIATNYWATPLFRKDIGHSNWDAGAAIADEVYAYHSYAYDVAGEQYNEVTSNPRMMTYVTGIDGDHVKEWPSTSSITSEINGRNKVAVLANGYVVCIIRTASAWQVQGSMNYGETYSLIYTLPGVTTDVAVAINPIDNLVYVAVIDASLNAMRVYSGNINGTSWALRSTTLFDVADGQLMGFRVDGTRFFVATGSRLYYSTNNCASFTARDLHVPSQHFAATGTLFYNLADQLDYRTTNYENTVIDWTPISQFETRVRRCTLHNSGAMTVYSQAELRAEGSEGNVVSILLSRNLGERWQEIQTPLNYYETFEQTLNLNDDPVWKLDLQPAKF